MGAKNLQKLGFLICGVQKCGTTALWHFLSRHSQIVFGPQKEMHVFDNEETNWNDPDYKTLHNPYAQNAVGKLWGDATPIYTYWPPSLKRIHAYNPAIKLVVILRNPVERAYSHWRMEVARNAETLSFSNAIRQGRKRISSQQDIEGVHRVYSYVERGFYAAQLARLLHLFPREQVLVLRQIDLYGNHRVTLDRICDFLAIDRFVTYPESQQIFSHRQEKVAPLDTNDRAYLAELYADDLAILRDTYQIHL